MIGTLLAQAYKQFDEEQIAALSERIERNPSVDRWWYSEKDVWQPDPNSPQGGDELSMGWLLEPEQDTRMGDTSVYVSPDVSLLSIFFSDAKPSD
jgi:hypothetical protein